MYVPDGFTNKEKDRLNELYGNDFEGATQEDIKLIARWEHENAQARAAAREFNDIIKTEIESRIEECRKTSETARASMQAITDAAVAAYERTV